MGHGATNGESSLARALLARLRPSLHATQQALHGARDELSPAELDEALGALQPALEMIDALLSCARDLGQRVGDKRWNHGT